MYPFHYTNPLVEMPDGTLKMTNPLTGRTAWWVPGRSGRPVRKEDLTSLQHARLSEPEAYCAFCRERLLETPPEIDRRVQEDWGYRTTGHLLPGQLGESRPAFRRLANLFQIVTLDYWQRNYDYRGLGRQREWAEAYKRDPAGRAHLLALMRTKLERIRGHRPEEVHELSEREMLEEADSFFLGCHQLIIGARHYKPGAQADGPDNLMGSSALTADEHFEYVRFTADAIRDIHECNRYVRYVVVFQNWLRPAGASFDHLHKQLVGLDDWGTSISREAHASRSDPNFYNALIVNFASYNNLVMAENEHAVMFADYGHRNPTLAIFCKARQLRPYEMPPEALRGVSDLVHAAHAAQGPGISCNEEWYYQPRDCLEKIPFHVLIKWRVSNPAGFEGGTQIFINPMRPIDMRDELVPELFRLRAEGRIAANIRIAEECPVEPNSLLYNR
jgi:galactose-1-phosphate uridylyltransferase